MRVLVTRPVSEARRTAAQLVALGHEAIVAPLTRIVPITGTLPGGVFSALIATSVQGFSPDCLPDFDQGQKLLPLFAVGERTVAAAQASGITNIRQVASTVSELSEAIIGTVAAGSRLLYITGRDRKPDLETRLANAGFEISILETYEARSVGGLPESACNALREGGLNAVLHFSRRNADLFVEGASAAGLNMAAGRLIHGALSEDVAIPLRNLWPNVKIAKVPTARSLYETLV